jgi:hypothetical protein
MKTKCHADLRPFTNKNYLETVELNCWLIVLLLHYFNFYQTFYLYSILRVFYAGFTFREIYSAGASAKKVACFHSLSDGKLLATGGHNMKVNMHIHTNYSTHSNGLYELWSPACKFVYLFFLAIIDFCISIVSHINVRVLLL